MKIWIDDERPKPDKFDVRVSNYNEFQDILFETAYNRDDNDVDLVSFDHDLGPDGNAYKIAKYIEEEAYNHQLDPFEWEIHSANPVGRKRIRQALKKADEFWNRQDHPLDDWQYLEDLWEISFAQNEEIQEVLLDIMKNLEGILDSLSEEQIEKLFDMSG